MKKISLIIIALCLFYITASSQSCLPEGIGFFTQSKIDSFQINYPGCTEIEGHVYIGTNIHNLNGLSVLTAIHGPLFVHTNLFLTDFEDLENLNTLGGLHVDYTGSLISFSGLENVVTFKGYIHIDANSDLISLSGLDNINIDSIEYILISSNKSLSHCAILSICNYMNIPNAIGINGNSVGCGSPEEVLD